ncbi:MAG: hypothetical protein PUK20_03880 [Firmicutes bacterium]|nr:hypothetical protein [Bacillota bacterium]MDY4106786.1 hypothetical protein [Oscillospiraceae bacterium]
MAEFDVLKEYARMVKPDENGSCTIGCINCPIAGANNGEDKTCGKFMRLYPEKATEIIRKWSEEHPQKTRGDLVLEHFPDAKWYNINPCHIFGLKWEYENCGRYKDCAECRKTVWDEVVE